MKHTYFIFGWLVIWVLSNLANASSSTSSHCAAASQIRSLLEPALQKAGFADAALPAPGEVTCPSVLAGTETLEVASLRWDALVHSVEVRMQCKFSVCLPFVVRVPQASRAPIPNTGHPLLRFQKLSPVPSRETRNLVRPGEIVTLLWEAGGLRITRTMVCLDRGSVGQQVRTRAKQGGRIVRARVLEAGLVKVEL